MLGYVGLDISQDAVVVCLVRADGVEPTPRWTIPNTQPGADALVARLVELATEHAVDGLRIGLEATGLYWWHLACALSEASALQPFQVQVYALNPKLVHDFRRNYGALPKTDRG